MPPQRRASIGGSRGHGRRTFGAGASSPSPLGRNSGRGSAVPLEALVTTRSWLFGYKIDGDEDDQELNGACVQFSKVTLNVDEEEVEGDEEEEEEVGLVMGDQTEFGDSSIS